MKRSGFTLLEVMVAVAILGLSLTAIFASESGSLRTAARARHTHLATLLARCKMGEIEEQVLREGFPAVDDQDRDRCCEGAEIEGFTCEWSITQVTLPTSAAAQQNATTTNTRRANAGDAVTEAAGRALGQIGTAGDFLAGGGDRGGLETMLLNLAIPVLNPAIESQVRRATVTVRWEEGHHRRSFDVSQFLVNEAQPNTEVIQRQMQMQTGTTGSTGTTGTTGAAPRQ